MMQRNAHLCATLAGAWLLFSAYAVFDWFDMHRRWDDAESLVNFGIWAVQLMLIGATFYFRKTEAPREVICFGESEEVSFGVMHRQELIPFLLQVADHADIQFSQEQLAQAEALSGSPEDSIAELLVLWRGKPGTLSLTIETLEESGASGSCDLINVSLGAHPDIADIAQQLLREYSKSCGY